MNKKVRILGKSIPIWLLAIALVASGAGAAVGTVLSGKVTGEMPVTVSQALLVGTPKFVATDTDWTDGAGHVQGVTRQTLSLHHAKPDRSIGTVSDDQTAFQAAAEVDTGDVYLIALPLRNASNQDMVVELKLICDNGLSVEVFGSDEETQTTTDYTTNVVRTGLNIWKFILKAEATKLPYDDSTYPWRDNIGINVAVADDILPGFYGCKGGVKQISY